MFTIYTNIESTGSSAIELGDLEYDLCIDGFAVDLVEEQTYASCHGRRLLLKYSGEATKQALEEVKALEWVEEVCWHDLCDHRTGIAIRPASTEELRRSEAQAELDGGYGIIEVDGVNCYVEG